MGPGARDPMRMPSQAQRPQLGFTPGQSLPPQAQAGVLPPQAMGGAAPPLGQAMPPQAQAGIIDAGIRPQPGGPAMLGAAGRPLQGLLDAMRGPPTPIRPMGQGGIRG
jgi:hypothetical protein